MAAERDRFSTATRLRALGSQARAKVYRASGIRPARQPRRSRLTGRAAVLALVLCALVVALAYPMRQYIAQRSQIAEQQEQARLARERVERLREEKARWKDPAFVRSKAREHLHYVMPGETGYVMADPSGKDGDDGREPSGAAAERPWYESLWDGVDSADAEGGR
ncbi:septum formation initiator family protein [Streptomyces sp. NPDC059506]|uniref:FtsB family cell division protein n=1 Tax=Streptomyces TaxID=1883 RepID=UPI00217508B3|nr:septum formation initiator family protein [Streptomyces sp. SCUT-3]